MLKLEAPSNKWVFLLLMAATLAVYVISFRNGWTYDDIPVILQNPRAQSLEAFINLPSPGRPLRELSYIVDYNLFGTNPAGYRIQQLLWHGSNSFLLYLLLLRFGLPAMSSLAGALLFIVHPLQVESVASIGHRKELLALFFSLSSFHFYLRALTGERRGALLQMAISAILFAIALLANLTVVTLPLAMLLYEWLLAPRERRLLLRAPLVTAGVAALAISIFFWRHRHIFDPGQLAIIYSQNNFFSSTSYPPLLGGILKGFGFYLLKLIVPLNLAPEYVIAIPPSVPDWRAVLSLLALGGLVLTMFRLRSGNPRVAFGLGWFLILYLPVSNLIPTGYLVADRYMYLCLPGMAMVAAAVHWNRLPKCMPLAGVSALLLLSVLTIVQIGYWRDPLTLWRHAAAVNPDSTGANLSAAAKLLDAGLLPEAEFHARRVLALNGSYSYGYYMLARVLDRQGKLAEAYINYRIFAAVGAERFPGEAAHARSYLPVLEERLRANIGSGQSGGGQ